MKSYIALLITTITLFSAHAQADDNITTRPDLLGDWGGYRTALAKDGVTFSLGYTSEVAHNLSGGMQKDTRYTDQYTLGTTLDLNQLLGWSGGTFQITYTDRNGRNLSTDANLGTIEQVQELYGRGQTLRLTQFWLNQDLLNGVLEWKIGRLTVGEDFANFSCDFQNLTFCGSQPGNMIGNYWFNWPVSQWGTRIKAKTSADTYIQLGVYQVNPTYASDQYAEANGWKLDNPNGTQGALIPIEFGWLPKINQRSGSYKLGFWYSNASGSDLYLNQQSQPLAQYGGDPLQRNKRYGAYMNLEQQITGQSDAQGTTLFLNATMADQNTSGDNRQVAVGMEYKAPFDRPNDMIGFALGTTHVNDRQIAYEQEYNLANPDNPIAVNQHDEYVSELFYSWSPLRSITFRPNLQYVVHPGENIDNKNTVVVGLKTIINL